MRTEATSVKLGNSVGPSSEDTSNDTAGLRECTDYNEYICPSQLGEDRTTARKSANLPILRPTNHLTCRA